MGLLTGRLTSCGVAVGLVATLTSCGTTPSSDPVTPDGGATAAVCAAAQLAVRGDVAQARRTFEATHDALHELAETLRADDRPAAAELLRAKQLVEAAEDGSDAEFRDALVALVPAAQQAEDAAGRSVTDCEAT